ncbi:MAG: hypothetical protein ACR2Q4_10705 [Geminicoccaceae bacterium]
MSDDEFAIVELDRQLAEDFGGSRVIALQKQLSESAEQCRIRLDSGVGPDEATRLNVLIAAYSAGLSILPSLWHAQQERN